MPRVRYTEASAERPLQSYQVMSYQVMKHAYVPEELTDAILLGLPRATAREILRSAWPGSLSMGLA